MSTDFVPSRESELVTWANNFDEKINSLTTTVGVSATQATGYSALNASWLSAYAVAQADATRSPMNVELKNVAKAALVDNTRLLAGIVQRFPGTTNAMRIDLGLPPRNTSRVPIPPPSAVPGIIVKSVNGRIVNIEFIDPENPHRRAKPPGVHAISLFSYVGDVAQRFVGLQV